MLSYRDQLHVGNAYDQGNFSLLGNTDNGVMIVFIAAILSINIPRFRSQQES